MTRYGNVLLVLVAFALLVSSGNAQESGADRLKELRFKFEVATEALDDEVAKDVASLNKKYLGALEKMRAAAKADEDLDTLVQIADEVKAIKAVAGAPFSPKQATGAKVSKLRATYRTQLDKFVASRDRKMVPLFEKYLEALAATKSALISQDDVENALAVREEEESVKASLQALKGKDKPPPTTAIPSKTASGQKKDGKWISKDASYTLSSRAHNGTGTSLLTREKETVPSGDSFAFMTAGQVNPYLVIDLGRQKMISGMLIINRTGMDLQRARTLRMTISQTKCFDGLEPVWKAEGTEKSWRFDLLQPVRGRYVKLGTRMIDGLHLSNVKVFGWETSDQSAPPIPKLTDAEGRALEDGLLAHFGFDSTTFRKIRSKIRDDISLELDGARATRSGHRGGGISFDGKDDQLVFSSFEWGAPLTISAWVKFRSFRGGSAVIQIGDGTSESSILIRNKETGSSLVVEVAKAGDPEPTPIHAHGFWSDKEWRHFTLTLEKGTLMIYKDGQPHIKKSGITQFDFAARSQALVGASTRRGGSAHFDGSIDDLRLYGRALSPAEVAALFRLDGAFEP